MKPILTLIAAYAICSRMAYAQPDESREFIYLYSDSVIYAGHIDLERNYSGSLYLWADSKRIHPEQVKFFQNNRGFFANVKDLNLMGETSFSERIRQGRINLYEAKTVRWDEYDSPQAYHPGQPVVIDRRNYYNVGFGSLKRANYVNLSIDLADNPKSMAFLSRYRSAKRTQMAMYVTAGASLLAGVVSFLSAGSGDLHASRSGLSSIGPGLALLGAGTGLAAGGYLMGPSATKHLKYAVDAYND